MFSASPNLNINGNAVASVTSMSQILSAASKVDLAQFPSQPLDLLPRVAGTGKEQLLQIAPDFDDSLEMDA